MKNYKRRYFKVTLTGFGTLSGLVIAAKLTGNKCSFLQFSTDIDSLLGILIS